MKRLANSLKLKRLAQFLCAIAALMTLTACPPDPVDTTGNLVGVVTDARSGELLSGVSISLSPTGKTYTTGADGKFEFRDIETQQYTVTASKTNYQTDKKTAFVNVGQTSNFDIQLTPATGQLSLSPTSLDFGNTDTNLTLTISNKGVAAMKWQLTEDASWLSCNPTSGTTQAGETSSVVVKVDRTGLSRGSYTHTIAVTSDTGGTAEVNVKVSVQGITVEVTPEQLDFGPTATSMNLTLTNTGSGTITYSAKSSNDWIHLSPKSGNFTTSDQIVVSVDRTGLSEGDHSGSVVLTISGEDKSIGVRMNVPSKAKPTVTTGDAANVSYSSAEIKGAIVEIGSSKVTKYGFCWATSAEPTVEDSKCNLGDASNAKDFSYEIKDLASSTDYYVRAYAENSVGVSYGQQVKFTTLGKPQVADVTTSEDIKDITYCTANAEGNITNLGNHEEVEKYGHVWSKKSSPTVAESTKTVFGPTSKTGKFNSGLTGLEPNTYYYVRAYAINKSGTAYGKDVKFKTKNANDINMTDYEEDNKWNP